MAWINRPKRKRTSEKSRLRRKLYNKAAWHRLSDYVRANHPLCAVCGKLAEHTHHIMSPFEDGLSEAVRIQRLLAYENCVALCSKCHDDVHKGRIRLEKQADGTIKAIPIAKPT